MKILRIYIIFLVTYVCVLGQTKYVIIDPRDGQLYNAVQIGNQIWMAQNLNYYVPKKSWCYHESNKNCEIYGRIYTYDVAKEVCMEGWRLPNKEDVEILMKTLQYPDASSLLKGGVSNFDALMGGWRGANEGFYGLENEVRFWTASEKAGNPLHAWFFGIHKQYNTFYIDYDTQKNGYYVRCIKINN